MENLVLLLCKKHYCKVLNTYISNNLIEYNFLYKDLICFIPKKYLLEDRLFLVNTKNLKYIIKNKQEYIEAEINEDNIIIDLFEINKNISFNSFQIYQIICEKKNINTVNHAKLSNITKSNQLISLYIDMFNKFN